MTMTCIMTIFEAAGLALSDGKRETTLLQTPDQAFPGSTARHRGCWPEVYLIPGRQATQFLYLGGVVHERADLSFEIERRIRLKWACLKRFGPELYAYDDRPTSSENPHAEGRDI